MSQPIEATTDVQRPSFQFIAAFSSLAIVSLAAALDATTLAVALPVSSNIQTPLLIPFFTDTTI